MVHTTTITINLDPGSCIKYCAGARVHIAYALRIIWARSNLLDYIGDSLNCMCGYWCLSTWSVRIWTKIWPIFSHKMRECGVLLNKNAFANRPHLVSHQRYAFLPQQTIRAINSGESQTNKLSTEALDERFLQPPLNLLWLCIYLDWSGALRRWSLFGRCRRCCRRRRRRICISINWALGRQTKWGANYTDVSFARDAHAAAAAAVAVVAGVFEYVLHT